MASREGSASRWAGEHGRSLFVSSDELLAALDATVADITEPLAPR